MQFDPIAETTQVSREMSRRDFIRRTAAAVGTGCFAASGGLGWVDLMNLHAEDLRQRGMACILLWMQGGPSQFESFDPKPGHPNGGPTKAIETAVPGLHIAEHWPQVASVMKEIALVRSMTNREGNHQRATYQLHTGYVPSASIKYPSLGSVVASQIGDPESDLPSFVAVGSAGPRDVGGGFLGIRHDPFVIRNAAGKPDNVELRVKQERFARRLGLLERLEQDFSEAGGRKLVADHTALYGRASRLSLSPHLDAFDLEKESDTARTAYGDSDFGRGCLLARRLVEAGVTFVEVKLGGWDTHANNFDRSETLSSQVDPAFAQLIRDLRARGMLEKTLLVWMGEFGRTPRINPRSGRDHFPRVFSAALAGAGIKGGGVVGETSADGTQVADRPVAVPDFFCSVYHALGINPREENTTPLGRPVKIVEEGKVVSELFT